jgi:ribonuclease VapC
VIVDSSAVVAILFAEEGRERLLVAILAATSARMSAASYVECGAVIDSRRDPVLSRRLDELLDALAVEVVAVTPADAALARDAYRDFGRGSGHAAGLNFGDCFPYALATRLDEDLLFTGVDFSHTNVLVAAW